jgi:hypothetical protein
VVDLLATGCTDSWWQWRQLRRRFTRSVHSSTGRLKLVAKSLAVTVGVNLAFTLTVTVVVKIAVTLAVTVADTMPEPDAQTHANPVSITL